MVVHVGFINGLWCIEAVDKHAGGVRSFRFKRAKVAANLVMPAHILSLNLFLYELVPVPSVCPSRCHVLSDSVRSELSASVQLAVGDGRQGFPPSSSLLRECDCERV